MNGLLPINLKNLFPPNTRSDLIDPKNEEHCKTINGIKFRTNSDEDLDNYGPDNYTGIDIVTNEQFIVSKKIIKKQDENRLLLNNCHQNYYIKSKGITSILEIQSFKIEKDHVYLFYKFYKFTLRKYLNPKTITEENLKYVLKQLFKAVDLIHSENIVLKNISLDNIAVVNENKKLTPKIVNLSQAIKSSSDGEYTKDKKDIGFLILSIFVDDKKARNFANNFENLKAYPEKFDPIHEIVKNMQEMPKTNIKNFADLIACLLNVKSSDNLVKFEKHIFFYTRRDTLEFLSAVNCRLNITQDARSKCTKKSDDVKERNEILKKISPKEEAKDMEIEEKLKNLLGDFAPKDTSLAERSREARNKEVHLEDDTETESGDEDGDEKSEIKNMNVSVEIKNGNHDEIQNSNGCKNKTKNSPKKDPKAWKKMSKILYKKGGAINVHLEADENFTYDLFNGIRIFAFNPNIRKFYIDSFLFEDPKTAYDTVLEEIKLESPIEDKREDAGQDSSPLSTSKTREKFPDRSKDDRNSKLKTEYNRNKKVDSRQQVEDGSQKNRDFEQQTESFRPQFHKYEQQAGSSRQQSFNHGQRLGNINQQNRNYNQLSYDPRQQINDFGNPTNYRGSQTFDPMQYTYDPEQLVYDNYKHIFGSQPYHPWTPSYDQRQQNYDPGSQAGTSFGQPQNYFMQNAENIHPMHRVDDQHFENSNRRNTGTIQQAETSRRNKTLIKHEGFRWK